MEPQKQEPVRQAAQRPVGPYLTPQPPGWQPIKRRYIDQAAPWIIGALAIAGFILSGITTVQATQWIQTTIWNEVTSVSFYAGVGIAFFLFAMQLVFSDRNLPLYLLFLIPDVCMTIWQPFDETRIVVRALTLAIWNTVSPNYIPSQDILLGADIATLVILSIAGIVAAYLPERVLAGKRRIPRRL
jgi:hypothetical protein